MMRNLRIEAILKSPVSITRSLLNIDGLIALAVANEMGLQDTKYDPTIKIKIPVEICQYTGVYKASSGFYVGPESSEKWHKRFDMEYQEYVDSNKQILIGRGYFKNYSMPIKIVQTKKIIWFARGEKNELLRLLNAHIDCLGKKRAQGYGIIKEWRIQEIEEECSLVFPNGNLSRQIPYEKATKLLELHNKINLDTRNSALCTYQFPYWNTADQEQCFLPKAHFKDEKEFLLYTGMHYNP